MWRKSVIALSLFLISSVAYPAEPLGQFPDLPAFKRTDYTPVRLQELATPKVWVLFFSSVSCPVAQRYTGVLIDIEKYYAPQGIQFVAVNVSPADSVMDMAQYALEYGMNFPIVKDTQGEAAKQLGITRTPEVAVLDAGWRLLYRGRVDDQFRLGGVRPKATRDDLRIALDEILAGKPVSQPITKAEGCSLTFPAVPNPSEPVTYAKDIAPILSQHCICCHRPGGAGPFSLLEFSAVAERAERIAEVMAEESMPPWYAHPMHGAFSNNPRLTEKEKLLAQQWVKGGKLEGNGAEAAAEPGWNIEPNVVLEAQPLKDVAPSGPHHLATLTHTFEKDSYIEAIEIRSNTHEVQLANVLIRPSGSMAPGGPIVSLPAGVALFAPKGSTLSLRIPTADTPKLSKAIVSVGLRFSRQPAAGILEHQSLKLEGPLLPPAFELRADSTHDKPITLIALSVHLGETGKNLALSDHTAGEPQQLLSLPNYAPAWPLTYLLAKPTPLAAGTRLNVAAQFQQGTPAPQAQIDLFYVDSPAAE